MCLLNAEHDHHHVVQDGGWVLETKSVHPITIDRDIGLDWTVVGGWFLDSLSLRVGGHLTSNY